MYRRRSHAIPFVISFELAFIDEGLTEEQYEQAVRSIVRQNLHHLPDEEEGVWEEYDERVSEIIAEELARN